jgi:SAM-dependent methyltransferase
MEQVLGRARQPEPGPFVPLGADLDPFTMVCLERIGVREGWQCLAACARGGSLTEWLCRRVGPAGRVVAVGPRAGELGVIDVPNLDVWCRELSRHAPGRDAFDLVWARGVLEHLPDPTGALRLMCAALRPGGWLFAEAADWASLRHLSGPDGGRVRRLYAKFLEALGASGFQPALGVGLGDELRALGLREVEVQGRTVEWSGAGDRPAGRACRAAIEGGLRRVTGRGFLSGAEADELLRAVRSPDFRAITMIHFAAWGWKGD